jgi:hypothetical protein
MKSFINNTILTSIDEVDKFNDIIENNFVIGIYNIDLIIEDIENADDMFWNKYEIFLDKISDRIIQIHKMKKINIALNILTDPIVKIKDNYSEDLIMCNACPCIQCNINRELFLKYSGFDNIPPLFYCKKSFLELKYANKIAKEIFNMELSDIDENDWKDLMIMKANEIK